MNILKSAKSWYSMSFAQRLHTLRKERGLTQRALAEASETHLTQIQRYESGETQPTLTALRKIAVALNVTTDTLVFEEGEREPTDDWKLQFEALSQFDDKEREVAKAVIDGLILRHTANRFSKAG